MLDWGLLTGVLPAVLLLLALAGGCYLVIRPGWRRWWTLAVPSVIVGAGCAAIVADWFVNDVWQAFTDPLPRRVVAAFGVGLAAVALCVLSQFRATWRRRVLALLSAAVVTAAAFNAVNQYYGYYPTLADALGQTTVREVALADLAPAVPAGRLSPAPPTGAAPHSPAGRPTITPELAHWRPSGPLPDGGAVSQVTIPGTVSGFHARPAWVYLPPAYLASPRPNLPVLMLIHGQFSNPKNWIVAGRVVATMDAFARRHHGIAPIVVMPDASGTTTGIQMCVDSHLGHVLTYLSRDVPDWLAAHLQVDTNTRHWAVGGFSYGGTCALELAVTHPRLFPTFLDISGEVAPTLGSTARTVAVAFGGDAAAYRAVQPLRILAAGEHDPRRAGTWRGVTGIFAVGSADPVYTKARATVVRACRKAGITTSEFTEPGFHSWFVAASALATAVPRLTARMGLG